MRLLSLVLSLLLPSLPSASSSRSVFSRLHSAVHRFHPLGAAATNNDILALQYALTLERLDTAFFTTFQQQFKTNWPTELANVYQRLEVIRADEAAHTATIEQALRNVGQIPVPACSYDFALVKNISDYITVGALLENTGVSAYDGALNSISDPILQQVGATIATVEARHAAYLNHVKGDSPFPHTLDIALRSQDVVSAIISLGVVKSCPFELPSTYPIPNPEGTALSLGTDNTTLPASTTYTPYTSSQATSDLQTLQLLYQFTNLLVAYNSNSNFTGSSQWNSYVNNAETYYTLLVNQDQAHAQALSSIITARGGTPASACTYYFGTTGSSLSSYLTTLDSLQTIILHAYDGIMNRIYDLELQTTVATIATVHSRHTAFVRELIGVDPFQQPLDNATTPEQAIAQILATGYITSCPEALVAPPPRAAAPIGTSAPTSAATTAPTSEATSAPTSAATSVPTSAATSVPTSAATSAPTSAATSAPTSAATSAPTSAPSDVVPTQRPGPSPVGPPFPGPNSNPPICPAINHTAADSNGLITFTTTTSKVLQYVDVHVAAGNQFLNYRMNVNTSNAIYSYQLPSFVYGSISYWFTYVTPDSEGVQRGCDTGEYQGNIPIPPGGIPETPSIPSTCPSLTFDYFVDSPTVAISFVVSEPPNGTIDYVDVHVTHLTAQFNYRMIQNGLTYTTILPDYIDVTVSNELSFWFTYGVNGRGCDTEIYTYRLTRNPVPPTSAPTTAVTSAPTTAATSAPTTAATSAPTTAATSAPTTAATSAPTSAATSSPPTGSVGGGYNFTGNRYPICNNTYQHNITSSPGRWVITYDTNGNITFVDVHIVLASGGHYNYRMNNVMGGGPGAREFIITQNMLLETQDTTLEYAFTYGIWDQDGIERGCDTPLFNGGGIVIPTSAPTIAVTSAPTLTTAATSAPTTAATTAPTTAATTAAPTTAATAAPTTAATSAPTTAATSAPTSSTCELIQWCVGSTCSITYPTDQLTSSISWVCTNRVCTASVAV